MRRSRTTTPKWRSALAVALTAIAALCCAAPAHAERGYVALGDSYSSGEGNPPFYVSSGACRRSVAAWPEIVSAFDSGIDLEKNLACSGASLPDLRGQLRGLPRATDLATVTIGGNDLGFGRLLASCYFGDCSSRLLGARTRVRRLRPLLVKAYRKIKSRIDGRLVVVGYPRLLPAGRDLCTWLSDPEKRRANTLTVDFDRTLALASATAHVRYVSVLDAVAGHELCTARPWIKPIGVEGIGDLRSEGHPTVLGQASIAGYVLRAIRRSTR